MLYRPPTLVKGQRFQSWRRVGPVLQAVKVYNMRKVDELVFLDVSATDEGREPDYALVAEFARECFVPLSVGGGISSPEHVRRLLHSGADKTVICTAAVERPELVSEIAYAFGRQCAVVAIDYKDGYVWTHSGQRKTDWEPVAWAKEVVRLGAGEILLQSIDRDGTLSGYDVATARRISDAVDVPVVIAGGAGSPDHMREALQEGKASAVGAGAMYHFTEQTPMDVKHRLHECGIPVRFG